ncbi:TonB-dependent receptor plug domain-containing protein [Nannocystis pusilla]|uniref:TonB-dependent receptor plug domain-containing protein n=1 Tax=Nannocystis pusilla TaxID=889268 RepID=UPI003DA5DEC0
MITLSLAACLLAAAPAPGQAAAHHAVQGTLRSAGERLPVAGARVFARARRGPAWTREAVSAGDGRFLLTDLPSRDFVLVVVATGHQRFEQPTPAAYWSRRKPPTIYLQPQGAGGYRTIVEQERVSKPSPVSTRLQPEEIANLPGSQGDPLRALQNLPGVARVPAGLGLLILRGAAPNQSQVFFGEHPLPRAFHIPGLASIVPAGVIGGIEYVPGNFSAHYGNAVGGIVHLTPRVGRRDGVHGHVKLDLITAGARVEGPFGKGGSYLLAAQRGYLDLVWRALPEDATRGLPHINPRYHDYQFIFDHPVGRGGAVTMRLLGADDTFHFRHAFDPREPLSMRSGFNRVDLAWRQRHGRWDFLLAPAVRFDRTEFDSGGVFTRRRNDIVGLLRAEASVRPWRPLQLTLGVDTQLDRYRAFVRTQNDRGDLVDTRNRGFFSNTGVYFNSQLDLGRYAIVAGARVSAFTGGTHSKHVVDPRLLLRYSPHERVRIQLAAGTYSQATYRSDSASAGVFDQWRAPGQLFPGPTIYSGDFRTVFPAAIRYLDPQLEFDPEGQVGALRATQYSANLHLDLSDRVALDATLFYRKVRADIAPDPAVPDAPTARSATGGLEVMLRHDLTARLFGWIAYTWMRSSTTFTFPNRPTPVRVADDFDQRHNLVMLVGYKLPRRWSIAGRFRLVTGLPYTPIIGSINADESWAFSPNVPVFGEPNGARMPVFHQLDLRLDRTWILARCVVGAYLDVMNVYNRQNAEGILYSQDYARTRAAVGLPILPVLGVQVTY